MEINNYNKCKCGRMKYIKARRCRKCFVSGKHRTVSAMFRRRRR